MLTKPDKARKFTEEELKGRIQHECTDLKCPNCHDLHDHRKYKCIPCKGDEARKPTTKTWLLVMEVTTPIQDGDQKITEKLVRNEFQWLAESDAYDGCLRSIKVTHCAEVKKK
jgi:hypothetical protein